MTAPRRPRRPPPPAPRPAGARRGGPPRARRPVPPRRRPGPGRSARRPAAILADVRERGADAVREAAARFGGGRPRRSPAARPAPSSGRPSTRSRPTRARRPRDRDRERPPVRRGPAARRLDPHHDRRRASSSSAAGSRSTASASTRPAAPRPIRARSSWASSRRGSRACDRIVVAQPRRRATATSTRSCSAPPACSASTRCSSRAASRRSAPSRTGSRTRAWSPWTSSSGPGAPGSRPPRSRSSARSAIDLPAGPSEGLVLADASADPVTVAADLITQAEHGPDSPALLVTPDEALADAVEAEVPPPPRDGACRRDILARALADHGRIVLVPDLDAGIAFVNGYAPGAPRPSTSRTSRPPSTGSATRARSSSAAGRPSRAGDYASGANHVLPDRRPRARAAARSPSRPSASSTRSSGSRARASRRCGPRSARSPRPRACSRTATPSRSASTGDRGPRRPGGRPMSPSPFAVTSPTDPASYSWEATDEGVAERFGIPVEPGPAVRPQHLARPARAARRLLAAGRFETTLSEYPPGDYRRLRRGGRRRATASSSTRSSRAPAPTRSSTCAPRRSCPRARRPSSRSRPTPCTASTPSSAAARVIAVPRRSKADGLGDGRPRDARRRPRGDPRLGCATRTTRPAASEPEGAIESPPRGHRRRTPLPTAARVPAVVVDEAYSEFTGALRDRRCGTGSRTSSRCGRPRRRTRWPGCGSGSRSARAETIRRIALYRAAGLDRHRLRRRSWRRRCADPDGDARRTWTGSSGAPAAVRGALEVGGSDPQPIGHQLPAARPRHGRARPRRPRSR